MRSLAALVLSALALTATACGDFRDPGDLRYPRLLAVRAEPPRVPAGARARIDLLVTNGVGVPGERGPDAMTPAAALPGRPAPPPEAAQLITQEDGAWYVAAPSEEVLARLRQAFGVPPDSGAPIPFPVTVTATLDGQPRSGEKVVWLGGSAANPTVTGMTVDGRPMEDSVVSLAAAGAHALTATAQGEGMLSFSWYSGFGELEKYREPTATLKGALPGESGAVVLVVRDDRGGVCWKLGSLRAE
jgi:hypothetical protein